jgi:hypothetical protein
MKLEVLLNRDSEQILKKASWLYSGDIFPYIFVRPDNHIKLPGSRHKLEWFKDRPIVYKNPLDLNSLEFAEQIYDIETKAFGPSNMAMPRWVFYDCAIVPGFVAGFAIKTEKLPDSLKAQIRWDPNSEFTPLSLFIIIPSMAKGEWIAHNLCSVNSLLKKSDQFYSLGFLTKAFGLWYANVETCVGMTQWSSPARKLHSHYGAMEILATYTPVHSHAETLTYRLRVNTNLWVQFFTKEPDLEFLEKYRPSGLVIDPKSKESLITLQHRIENGEGSYFLSAAEIAQKDLDSPLTVFTPKT